MANRITARRLVHEGLGGLAAAETARRVNRALAGLAPVESWRLISQEILLPSHPFAVHKFLFETVFADWPAENGPPPAWTPTEDFIETTNAGRLMKSLRLGSYEAFRAWTAGNREAFWAHVIERFQIRLRRDCGKLLDSSQGVTAPRWLPGAKLNIVDSCFPSSADAVAVVYQRESGSISRWTYAELESLTNRVACGLVEQGFRPGDAIALDMPMTAESVAIYLGILKAGCVVVSIADSFAPREIATRIRLGEAKAVFTQDVMLRGGKVLPLYEKIVAAHAPMAIVLPEGASQKAALRPGDRSWEEFLGASDRFEAVARDPGDPINILFSSGTTADPKAIPWTQTAPIKCAADGYFHQDIRPRDVIAWPTNLGWMMGPWLVFAGLLNRATIAIYYGPPTGREFGRFVQDAQVTMLGLVPSLVRMWRHSGCMRDLDWSRIKVFSSTGEASNAEDMLWLMALAGYRPVIEYCGGTEIAGAYITGTVLRPCVPGAFNSLALGLDAVILDEEGKACDNGEIYLVPPSIGMSTELLHREHDEVYFAGTPKGPDGEILRRHGDQVERLPNGYYRAHGRVDDAMNLGGIKVSSAEIERVLNTLPEVAETAVIAVPPPGGGPSRLVICAVPAGHSTLGKEDLIRTMQSRIKEDLNPLFRIHDVVWVKSLPRTASNKVMRRVLRDQYSQACDSRGRDDAPLPQGTA